MKKIGSKVKWQITLPNMQNPGADEHPQEQDDNAQDTQNDQPEQHPDNDDAYSKKYEQWGSILYLCRK